MDRLVRVLAFLTVVSWTLAARTDLRETETEVLRLLLNPERYDKRVRPPALNETGSGGDDYVLVRVNTLIRYIGPIDDNTKDYIVSLTMRQTWNDRRLQFSPRDDLKYIALTSIEDIWSPDLFFSNEKEGHINEILKPNSLVRISTNGDVLYSTRVTLKLYCPMDFTNFPMDNHICYIRMASYAYPTNSLIFLWKEEEPVQFVRNLNTNPFEVQGFKNDYCNSKTVTGEYSCVRIQFFLQRLTRGYISQLYLPLGFLVVVSWAPLWLDFSLGDEKSLVLGIIGRCLIALLCLLTTITEAAQVSASAPPCSGYSCAVDIWTTWCQISVALVLLEVVIVAVINHWQNDHHCKSGAKKPGCLPTTHGGVESGDSKFEPQTNALKKWLMGWPTTGQRIDVLCRLLFPLAFVIFNVAYWSAHTNNLDEDLLSSMNKIPF